MGFPGELDFQLLSVDASMGANITSGLYNLNASSRFCIQYHWAAGASPVGTATLQGSNDESIWTDISSQGISGNTGNGMFNVEGPSFRSVRLIYTRVSGTATLNANINARFI